jgi:hypothetical protein
MPASTLSSSAAAEAPHTPSKLPYLPENQQHQHAPMIHTRKISGGAGAAGDDVTASTFNCDDSMSTDHTHTQSPHSSPPVAAVNVDRRGVRQRLRDQEAKINALLHRPAASGSSEGVLLKLVKALEADLKKTEVEKQHLQEELDRVRSQRHGSAGSSSSDHFHQSLSSVGVDDQEEHVEVNDVRVEELQEQVLSVQLELQQKSCLVEVLQDRLDTTLRRLVQVQLDLETHQLHFTDYAASQFATGKAALKELTELTAKDQSKSTRKLGKHAKQMLSTILNDLEVLGEKYQLSQIQHENEIASLQQDLVAWQQKAERMADQLRECNVDVTEDLEDDRNSLDIPKLHHSNAAMQWQKKYEVAENARDTLQKQLDSSILEKQQLRLEHSAMAAEVKRLQGTVQMLEQVTRQQHEALAEAQAAAAAAASKKKKGLFGRKKKASTPTQPPVTTSIDMIQTALAPIQEESTRFETVQGEIQDFTNRMAFLQAFNEKQAKKNAEMKQELVELRAAQSIPETNRVAELEAQVQALQIQLAEAQGVAQDTSSEEDAQAKEA